PLPRVDHPHARFDDPLAEGGARFHEKRLDLTAATDDRDFHALMSVRLSSEFGGGPPDGPAWWTTEVGLSYRRPNSIIRTCGGPGARGRCRFQPAAAARPRGDHDAAPGPARLPAFCSRRCPDGRRRTALPEPGAWRRGRARRGGR